MARESKVGRNDRCPCGSGRKYKNCCQRKAGRRMGLASWAAVAGIVAAAVVLVVFLLNLTRGDSVGGSARCPPGQVWSSQHGHCHSL